MTLRELLAERTDWRLLAEQKRWLLGQARQAEEAAGLVHFLDALQDAAVEELGLAEGTVFPELPARPP